MKPGVAYRLLGRVQRSAELGQCDPFPLQDAQHDYNVLVGYSLLNASAQNPLPVKAPNILSLVRKLLIRHLADFQSNAVG